MVPKPVLEGRLITLRPVKSEDADAVFASQKDDEVSRLTGTLETFTLEQVKAHYANVGDAPDRVDYAIISKVDNSFVGEVVLNAIDSANRSANFRIALMSQEQFGKGYGTEATRLMVKHGFESLNLHRIDLEVFAFNPRAIHVYEKVGFVKEGLKRDVLFWEGQYHDAVIMGFLKPDYEESKGFSPK